VGYGTELLFVLVLSSLLLGPRKLPSILGKIARAKAQLKQASQAFTTELDAAPEPHPGQPQTNLHARTGGRP
jgi:Sec-independent protein translocase protein TatA